MKLACMLKDESEHIRETIESVRPYISGGVILDTGSTDGTQDIVRELLCGPKTPIALHEEPFVDFSTSRNRLMDLCNQYHPGEWFFMVDGGSRLIGDFSAWPMKHTYSAYSVNVKLGNLMYPQLRVFKAGAGWAFAGKVHEYCSHHSEGHAHLESVVLEYPWADKAREKRWARDLQLLLEDYAEGVTPRGAFYLGSTYECLGKPLEAMKYYGERAEMSEGWEEEQWEALCRLGRLAPWPQARSILLAACEMRPWRSEPWFFLAERVYQLPEYPGKVADVFSYAVQAYTQATPEMYEKAKACQFFVAKDIYFHKAHVLYAYCLDKMGEHEEAERVRGVV